MRYYLGLGSNLGDSKFFLRQAVKLIEEQGLGKIVLKSSLYLTEPKGGPRNQNQYLNAAAAVESSLSPEQMMAALQKIESDLGRTRNPAQPNRPRKIDLDILVADDIIKSEPGLIIPHPRMADRRFVLEPLSEIAPDLIHPVLKKSVLELLRESGDKGQVTKLGEKL